MALIRPAAVRPADAGEAGARLDAGAGTVGRDLAGNERGPHAVAAGPLVPVPIRRPAG